MKILRTLGYLLIMVSKMPLHQAQQKRTTNLLTRSKGNVFLSFLLSVLILCLGFVQFWLLTNIFPLILLIALIGASLFGLMVNAAIGAFAGLTIKEKKQKVSVLSIIWGINRPAIGCAMLCFAFLVLLFSTSMSLWIFWSHPIGDSKAIGWIAFYEFIFPQIIAIPLGIILIWPLITSEFMDDDCRNSFLSGQFSQSFTMAVTLLFPLWVFEKELGTILGFVPPFWLLLSVPFFCFLLGGVFPYIIGTWKYRAQSRAMLRWRQSWLAEVLSFIKLPEGEQRSSALDDMAKKLEGEIQKRVSEHQFFDFFQQLIANEKVIEAAPNLLEAAPDNVAIITEATVAVSSPQALATITKKDNVFDRLKSLSSVPHLPESMNPLEQAHDFIRNNRENLVDWDVSFAHISKLLHLQSVTVDGKNKDLSQFIENRLANIEKNISDLSQKRPVVLTTIWGALTTIPVFIFKVFEEDIIKIIQKLVANWP